MEHLFVNTSYGEVMVKESFEDCEFCEVYIGDNYDQYIGEIPCTLDDDEDLIIKEVEELLG